MRNFIKEWFTPTVPYEYAACSGCKWLRGNEDTDDYVFYKDGKREVKVAAADILRSRCESLAFDRDCLNGQVMDLEVKLELSDLEIQNLERDLEFAKDDIDRLRDDLVYVEGERDRILAELSFNRRFS